MEPGIIFEDDELIVLNKPPGMIVNRADTTRYEITVQDWIEANRQINKSNVDLNEDFYKRSGIVHRLDKETSGILLIAKTIESFSYLQHQFKERLVKKNYIALVHGRLLPPEGEINVPLGRLSWNRKRFGVVAGGRDSKTFYKTTGVYLNTLNNKELLTLLELFPQTGRTHQIRVHLKYLQHPIFSDALYGGRKTAIKDRKILPRLFLHASEIHFTHPSNGNEVSYTSILPDDLKNLLMNMQKQTS